MPVVMAQAAPQASTAGPVATEAHGLPAAAQRVVSRYQAIATNPKERARLLVDAARSLAPLPDSQRIAENRVMGCTAQVWVTAALDASGKVAFSGTSDSELTAGVVAVMCEAVSGLTPEEVLAVDERALLGALALGGLSGVSASRANAAGNIWESMKRRTRALRREFPRFPSLHITADALTPQGAFAQAQAQYLEPDAKEVDALVSLLSTKKIGVVAHFYMDPQVQGVLSSAAERWPHVAISDSLVMADTAVRMAQGGCKYICVLGVDFMSENVRAILDDAGHTDVQVYRMSSDAIGCSLAEAAESEQYMRYLDEAGRTPQSMHVVYINTSLYTKAAANARVPTITCTSSNVVQTVLQGFAQVPNATVWYGPDTYMGRNLAQLFTMLSELPDEEVRALHPAHTAASVKAALPRLKYYDNGTCIVHHIFGGEVCEIVREAYGDAYLTAHFEVPGEMFSLAMAAKSRGMGVVGSTSNILDYISGKVTEALGRPHSEHLQFVLGTEAGMITSIVRKVQKLLQSSSRRDVTVEIVFPVSPKAITTAQQATSSGSPVQLPGGLAVLPGPAGGEGCSLEGGCAACPYMRMNTLQALRSVCERAGAGEAAEAMLEGFKPRPYADKVKGPDGSMQTVAQAGCVPILHMRHFQQKKELPPALVAEMNGSRKA